MNEYLIDVREIEELQMIRNVERLDKIFDRAKRTVVHGSVVVLARKQADGSYARFDELDNEPDLQRYRETVYKYL
jgi:hypothetical protein